MSDLQEVWLRNMPDHSSFLSHSPESIMYSKPVFNLGPLYQYRKSVLLLHDQQLFNQSLYENNSSMTILLIISLYILAVESSSVNVLVAKLFNCDLVQPYSIRLSGPTLKTGLSKSSRMTNHCGQETSIAQNLQLTTCLIF